MTDNRLTVAGFSEEDQRTLDEMWDQLLKREKPNAERSASYDMGTRLKYVGGVVPPTYYREATVLGWTAKVALEDGLLRTARWLESNLDRYDPHRYHV